MHDSEYRASSLKTLVKSKWVKKFNAEILHIHNEQDFTSLRDFLASALVELMENYYFYSPLPEEKNTLGRLIEEEVRKILSARDFLTFDDAFNVLLKVFETSAKEIAREGLKNKGVFVTGKYATVRVLFGSQLRWQLLKLLSKRPLTVKELASELSCREEVVRRFLSDLTRLGLVEKVRSTSSRGRPVYLFKLKARAVIVDLADLL